MAKQQMAGGGVLGKVAQRMKQAHEAHKADETEYSKFGELPGGIEGGIARLVDAKFDVFKEGDNKGEPFFYAAGVVVSPTEFTDREGITYTIEGLRTTLGPIPLCDTKAKSSGNVTTLDEHVKRLYNELRKLGVATATLPFEQLEGAVATLKQVGPHFKFRTWKGKPTDQYPDPRVNHDWQGYVKFAGQSNGSAVQDATPVSGTQTTPAAKAPATQPKANGAQPPKGPPVKTATKPAPAPEPEPEAFDEFGDLASLVSAANNDDGAAQDRLSALAAEAGKEQEALAAGSWQEVADLIQAAQGGGAADEAGEWQPQPGELYNYRPVDPRTRKPAATPVLVEVVEADPSDQTVRLKNPKNPKATYPKVPWADLESAD